MSRFRCSSCDGEFADVLADKMLYFHVCPVERVVPNPVPGTPDVRRRIPNRRDENLTTDSRGERLGIRAEGAGRVPAPVR